MVTETLACHTEAVAARRVRPSATSPLPGMECDSERVATAFPGCRSEAGADRAQFRALLAPFAVTTDETAQALATGEIAPIESRGSESGSWRGEVPRED